MAPRRLSVLLVDRIADERPMYTNLLGGFGIDVRVSQVAVERAIRNADALLLRADPHRSGLDLLRRIKRLQSLPVIILTTSILDTDRDAAEAAGCDGYYLVPCQPEELASAIWQAVARRRRPATGTAKRRRLG